MPLYAPFGTSWTYDIAVANADGPVEGANVVVTIEDRSGAVVVDEAAMSDLGGGNYSYEIDPALIEKEGGKYVARVTAVAGGRQAMLRSTIYVPVDET